ncbi:uncharacterized protein LOC101894797 [Musca domestica]|nr:uncharacterized protein LOC101894797 [Musca domestica]
MVAKKLIFALFVGILCSVYARSVSVIGDVHIVAENDNFQCDQLRCPLDAERCLVTKENDPKDPSILVRTNICYSKNGVELDKLSTRQTVDPNSQIKVRIEGYRNGLVSSINIGNSVTSNDFDSEEFEAEMEKFNHDLNKGMEELNKGLNQMSYNLAHMFD